MTALPPASVPPDAYDEEYYLNACLGYEEWRRSGGARIDGLYAGVLARAAAAPGELVIDIGCGRGELVVAAAELGARAIGIEYSQAAIELSRRTLRAHGDPPGASVLLADARRLPLPDGAADLVTLIDVIEHLDRREQADALREARRVLRPGGRILVHTLPNRLIYDLTYRTQRALKSTRRRTWPRDPRNDYERRMHVGELSALALRRALRRAGFGAVRVTHGAAVYADFVPERRCHATYFRLAAHRLTRPLGAADLWGEART